MLRGKYKSPLLLWMMLTLVILAPLSTTPNSVQAYSLHHTPNLRDTIKGDPYESNMQFMKSTEAQFWDPDLEGWVYLYPHWVFARWLYQCTGSTGHLRYLGYVIIVEPYDQDARNTRPGKCHWYMSTSLYYPSETQYPWEDSGKPSQNERDHGEDVSVSFGLSYIITFAINVDAWGNNIYVGRTWDSGLSWVDDSTETNFRWWWWDPGDFNDGIDQSNWGTIYSACHAVYFYGSSGQNIGNMHWSVKIFDFRGPGYGYYFSIDDSELGDEGNCVAPDRG